MFLEYFLINTQHYLGVIWSVLNPLLSMVVMSLIFSTMFKRSIENYPIYYLTGTIIWNMFTGVTNSAMTALVDNKTLMTRTRLPRQIFPLSRILTSLVNFGYSLIAYVLIVAFFRIVPSVHLAVFPVITLLLLLFSTGFSYILTILYSYMYRISGRDAYAPFLVAAGHDERYLKAIRTQFSFRMNVE